MFNKFQQFSYNVWKVFPSGLRSVSYISISHEIGTTNIPLPLHHLHLNRQLMSNKFYGVLKTSKLVRESILCHISSHLNFYTVLRESVTYVCNFVTNVEQSLKSPIRKYACRRVFEASVLLLWRNVNFTYVFLTAFRRISIRSVFATFTGRLLEDRLCCQVNYYRRTING